ncbi:iron-sulfur cluster regulator IscR [Halorhodospira halochloris]|uniref:Iron-sulfur cluster regulator IscR n=1 Tax=Halorhodospira halochloris TaxID=1052 RepID=A0A120MZQ7_HALHR|nr:Rrf2 family transcriptional regulator [Halorhodospira halochloris]MBK1651119.1 hypothetical protein [Halorhodospira halochloris]BAU57386.2 iron-sulfur cluster regulator IscR [Halorhodospira halochloris]
MRLSTRGRYAVSAMVELTRNVGKRPVTLAEISASQGISLSYLEQLFAPMRRENLVYGVRGPGGGYRLAKSADQITVAQIIMAVDGYVGARTEQDTGQPAASSEEQKQAVWADLSKQVYELLNRITLQQMADGSGEIAAVRGDQAAEGIDETRDREASRTGTEPAHNTWRRTANR